MTILNPFSEFIINIAAITLLILDYFTVVLICFACIHFRGFHVSNTHIRFYFRVELLSTALSNYIFLIKLEFILFQTLNSY